MDSSKISIVIPSFNKVEFIGETLESIFSQKYPNLEVIIQDGGSTDGTLEIIKKFVRKYTEIIKWESKKDNGQLDAVNKGLRKATGAILTFINADDVYAEGSFRSVAEAYINHPDALWFAGKGAVINENGKVIAKVVTSYKNLFLFLNLKSLILILNYLMQPSVFFTGDAYKKYGPFTGTPNFIMEYDLWLKIGQNRMPVVINTTLSKFRIEANTKTQKMSQKLLLEDERVVKKYTKNPLVLFLHNLHNLGRIIIGKFV